MNKLIENHKSDNYFFPTGVLAEITGRLNGNIHSMRDDNLDSLDKKYYADEIAKIHKELKDMSKFMFDQGMHMIKLKKGDISLL